MRGTWTFVLMLVISAFCQQAQEGNPEADVWVPADTYHPKSMDTASWGFATKRLVRMEPYITSRAAPEV